MPPKRSSTASAGPPRKTASSIASSFKPAAKSSTSTSGINAANQSAKAAAVRSSSSSSSSFGPLKKAASTVRDSVSPEKTFAPVASSLSKEEIQKAADLKDLDVEDSKWNGIWKSVQREKLGKVGAIHAEGQNRIHLILRTFDLDPSYGPCLGLTRLERWQRAKALGEDPPIEVWEILNTKQGTVQDDLRTNCLQGMGV